jgi:hypothetical protein
MKEDFKMDKVNRLISDQIKSGSGFNQPSQALRFVWLRISNSSFFLSGERPSNLLVLSPEINYQRDSG